MTQAELDALPEDGGIERMRVGSITLARARPGVVLWTDESEPAFVVDAHGMRWLPGWFNGVRYKRKLD